MPNRQDKQESVFIGTKPLLFYASRVSLALMSNRDVMIKARGRKNNAIALDVAEIVCRNNGYEPEIHVSSEDFERDDGKKYKVTAVEICIKAI